MAEYGIHIYDENEELIVDTTHLLHRLWHVEVVTSPGTSYYDEPLEHEPTVVAQGVNAFSMLWEHVKDGNDNYIGIQFTATTGIVSGDTLVCVYARR